MKLFKLLAAFAALMLLPVCVNAQTRGISGKVSDNTGAPLRGVIVYVQGSTENTMTGDNGSYAINARQGQTLVFSLIGYTDETVVVGNSAVINVTLQTDKDFFLDETVVVGYGSQSKRTITQAITKVKGSEMENIPVASVGDALKGKIAGARIYTTNFTPGSDPTILIRGGSSINGTQTPLVLIDGIERSLAAINPSDIESVEILKDAASSAIYGSRASNGVVLVTTKSGTKSRAPRITFDASVAYQEPESMLEYLNAEEFLTLQRTRYNHVLNNSGQAHLSADNYAFSSGNSKASQYSTRYLQAGESVPAGYKSMADPLDPSKTLIFQDNNWIKESFAPAWWQNYYVSVDGGTDNMNYMASIGYTDDDGVVAGSDYDRLTARTNLDVKINKNLRFKGGLDYQQTNTNTINNQYNVISRGLLTPPTQKFYYDYGENEGLPTKSYNKSSYSPLFYEYYVDNNQKRHRFGVNGSLEWDILPGLKAVAQASSFFDVQTTEYFYAKTTYDGTRPANTSTTTWQRDKIEAYLNYANTFGQHSISAMAGYSYQKYNYFRSAAAVMGAATDVIHTLNAGSTYTEATSSKEKEVGIGYFGRFNYDYAKKYLLTLTFRYDGSSRFLEGSQWGFFPGASAGWVITEEPWFNIRNLNNLKLRASYGKTGNNYVGYYDAVGQFGLTTNYNGNAAITTSAMPNSNLTWENTTQLDLGFDLGLFENRITAAFDCYDKLTDNLIFSKTLPNTSGYGSVKTNIGQVRYYGIDFELNSRNIVRSDFTWTTKFVWSWNDNVVVSLPDNGLPNNAIGAKVVQMADGTTQYIGGTQEGMRLGNFYGYEVDYLIKTQAQADAAPYHSNSRGYDYVNSWWAVNTGNFNKDKNASVGKVTIGDWCYKDFNGDGIVNSTDAAFYRGNILPKHTGGLGNTFTWKNWVFDIYVDWALGFQSYNGLEAQILKNIFAGNANLTKWVYKCWDPETNPDSEFMMYKGCDADDLNKNVQTNQYFVQNNDYLCLRDVSLSYNLRAPWLKRANIQNILLTLSGNNLKYFSEIKGINPELGTTNTYSSNNSFNTYPAIRKISFGAKITF